MRDNATMSRRKKVARLIASGKIKTAEEVLLKVGYSVNTAHTQAGRVIKSPEVQNELKRLGFTTDNADRAVVGILNAPLYRQLITPSDKIAAAREVYKVTGAYAPDKHINLNASLSDILNNAHKADNENDDNVSSK